MKVKWFTFIYSILLLLLIIVADQGNSVYLVIFKMVSFIPYGDKIGHFLLIGILTFAVNLSLHCRCFKIFNVPFLKGSVFILCLITLEEFSQIFISSRTFDLGDLAANYIGILLFGQIAQYYIINAKQIG